MSNVIDLPRPPSVSTAARTERGPASVEAVRRTAAQLAAQQKAASDRVALVHPDDAELRELMQRIARDSEELTRTLRDLLDQANQPAFVSTGAAARELGVSVNTVKKWARLGLLRDTFMAGAHLRIPRTEVERVRRLNAALDVTDRLGSDEPSRGDDAGSPSAGPWKE